MSEENKEAIKPSETVDEILTDEVYQEEEASEKSELKMSFNKQEKTDRPYWYVVYTYSGYENKVMTNLLKTVENQGLEDCILDVKVPMEETIEVKTARRSTFRESYSPDT